MVADLTERVREAEARNRSLEVGRAATSVADTKTFHNHFNNVVLLPYGTTTQSEKYALKV